MFYIKNQKKKNKSFCLNKRTDGAEKLGKIGIFGGTFDPPHNGHLLMANEVLHSLNLDKIWFMPNNIPPHKQKEPVTETHHRVNMLKRAIEGNPFFQVQLIELEREGPSFTYDTVKILKERYPNEEFYFIIGSDMIENLPHWHRIEELMDMVQFVGVKRNGYSNESTFFVKEVEVPQFDVSSTMIRERLKNGQAVDYLLPKKVIQYIGENRLYGT
ncbi:nicotinate-nucleotide adenylyltransferase [Aeribacillus composti]|nr:nicotinate-nucleotide adenylyltransferase [Aeribacillus composti]